VTFDGYFRYCKRFHCLYLKKYNIVNYRYNCRTSYVSNYFYCQIRPEAVLAERDVLTIAKFLVVIFV